MRRSRCFVLDQQLRVCEVLTLSKPKRTVTPYYVYMSAQPLPIEASGIGIDDANITFLHQNLFFLVDKT